MFNERGELGLRFATVGGRFLRWAAAGQPRSCVAIEPQGQLAREQSAAA